MATAREGWTHHPVWGDRGGGIPEA